MKERYLLGIDLGTSGLKAGLVSPEGSVIAGVTEKTPTSFAGAGKAGQEADRLVSTAFRLVPQVCAKAGVDPSRIAGVGVDGQMGGIIGVDDRFEPVTGLDMGLDLAAEKLNDRFHERHRSTLLRLSCGSPRNTPKIAWWKEHHPDIYRRVRRFTTIGGYTVGALAGLSGEDAYIDTTLLAYFGNEDAGSRSWSPELTEAWGVDLNKMPIITDPWKVVGTVSAAAAAETGLRTGTPIVAGAGDQPAGFWGGGFESPGTMVSVGGSTTILAQCVPEFRPESEGGAVMYIPAVTPGHYYVIWYINGGGLVVPWFEREIAGGRSVAELTPEADAIPPGCQGLLFSPYFGGRQNPYNRTIRGGWIGLNWGHTTAHMLRSLFEGIAAGYRGGYESMRRLFPEHEPATIHAIGGATENSVLMRVIADMLQRPLTVHPGFDASIRGSALLAGVGLGWYDLTTVPKLPEGRDALEVVVPSRGSEEPYTKLYSVYADLFNRPLTSLFEDLAENGR